MLVRNAFLAEGAHTPIGFVGFIPADVHILRGEKFHHFFQDILEEGEHLFPARTYDFIYVVLAVLTEKFGMHPQQGNVVSGDFNFGNHLDMTVCRVSDDFTNLIFRIVSAVNLAVIIDGARHISLRFLQQGHRRAVQYVVEPPTVAEGTFLDHFRRAVQSDAPALIVGQVQMQAVHLQLSHQVQLLQDEIFAVEMTGHIEHQAPVGITGSILDAAGCDAAFFIRRLELQERLDGIESTGDAIGLNADAFAVNGHFISALADILQEFWPDLDFDGGRRLFVGLTQGKRTALYVCLEGFDLLVGYTLGLQTVNGTI